jgi:hypothetical protein
MSAARIICKLPFRNTKTKLTLLQLQFLQRDRGILLPGRGMAAPKIQNDDCHR